LPSRAASVRGEFASPLKSAICRRFPG
jgi:hypothetical protein